MKRIFVTLVLFLTFLKAYSQDFPQKKIETKIEHVTVFLNGAQVTSVA
jgi:hypothetical protein